MYLYLCIYIYNIYIYNIYIYYTHCPGTTTHHYISHCIDSSALAHMQLHGLVALPILAGQLEFVPSGPIELSLTQGYWTESLDQLPFLGKSSDFLKNSEMRSSTNGGTPSHHPFLDGIFPYKPSSYCGTPMAMETTILDGFTRNIKKCPGHAKMLSRYGTMHS